MARASAGRLLAERYELTERRRGAGVEATDTRSGAPVLLEAVPLPELVRPFDQLTDAAELEGAPGGPADENDAATLAFTQATAVAQAVGDHPRLNQVFQVFAESGYLWAVGERIPGVPLAQLLEDGPLTPYRAAEVVYDVATGLEAVHRAGIVHGNVTALSVTVCEDGTALLGGLAVSAAQEALCGGPGTAQAGAGVPTALWSPARVRARDARSVVVGPVAERWAPEQLGVVDGTGVPVGPAADVWALGVLLYRVCTGAAPFPEHDPQQLFHAVRTGALPDPRSAGPVWPLVVRLLDADPNRRPGLGAVRTALRRLLQRAPEPLTGATEFRLELPPADRAVTAARLPVQRPPAEVAERHHHAAPKRGTVLLGPLLVGGIILVTLIALVLVTMLAR
jgi:serine/threonine protein kinase